MRLKYGKNQESFLNELSTLEIETLRGTTDLRLLDSKINKKLGVNEQLESEFGTGNKLLISSRDPLVVPYIDENEFI